MSSGGPRRIYVDTDHGRLGAQLSENPVTGVKQALVWRARGEALGYYNLSRFEDEKLTAATLKKLFARKENH